MVDIERPAEAAGVVEVTSSMSGGAWVVPLHSRSRGWVWPVSNGMTDFPVGDSGSGRPNRAIERNLPLG